MNRTSKEIENICKKLINRNVGDSALEVSHDEFQKFYTTVVHLTKTNPVVSFVNLESIVIAQFSSLSPQHFDITNSKDLTENDFDFVVSLPDTF